MTRLRKRFAVAALDVGPVAKDVAVAPTLDLLTDDLDLFGPRER